MARRRVKQAIVGVVQVEAPKMITFDVTCVADLDKLTEVECSFIRLRPAPGMSPDELADLKARFLAAGAAAVRAMPIPAIEQAVAPLPDLPNVADRSMRAVVMDRFKRAQNLGDRDAVEAALNESLDAAGL